LPTLFDENVRYTLSTLR